MSSTDENQAKAQIDLDGGLQRLLGHAYSDTGGSRRCAMSLLSLWNGDYFKASLQDMIYIDTEVFDDMLALLRYMYKNNYQLYSLVSEKEMKPIIDGWGDAFRVEPGS